MQILSLLLGLVTVSALTLPFHQPDEQLDVGNDPATSWLTYAVAKGSGKLVTYVNCTWTVPSYPTQKVAGNAPGWWFGIEPEPAAYLIQPVNAWGYDGNVFSIFNGYYQWNNGDWWHSPQLVVVPGNTIYSSLTYDKTSDAYLMNITCVNTGKGVLSKLGIADKQTYTDVYFVMEHQPQNCKQLPSNGQVTFQNIYIEWEGQAEVPTWTSFQYKPACNSNTTVVSPSEIKMTFSTS